MNTPMPFDRSAEDIGNIVEFGHVNVRVPDQTLATLFYVTGLGLTRDPYLVTGIDNMWINAGTTQFHLPTGAPQVLGGVTVMAMPDLDALAWRLGRVAPMLQGTRFEYSVNGEAVHTTSPWGNRLRIIQSGQVRLGIVAVEIDTAPGTAKGIARFYRHVFGTPATHSEHTAFVPAGLHTTMIFRETETELAPFDGTHVQISLADFSGPHARLVAAGLITEESNQHQYRFEDIIDPDDGRVLCSIEHEVRSMRHPSFARPLINRDPTITNARYAPGREALILGSEPIVI